MTPCEQCAKSCDASCFCLCHGGAPCATVSVCDQCVTDCHPTCACRCHGVGRKYDAGKPRWDLLPWRALEQVAAVLEYGARKYAPENWRKVAGWRWRDFRAAVGHLAKWRAGEALDAESDLPHLAHAACCVLFLLELDRS